MFEKNFKDYLEKFVHTSKNAWNYETYIVLSAAKEMNEAVGDAYYLEKIAEYIKHYILEYDSLENSGSLKQKPEEFSLGKFLNYSYEQTQDESYKTALETIIMNNLREYLGGCESGLGEQKCPEQIGINNAYMILPLYLEYETKYNQMKNYNDIYMWMKNVRNKIILNSSSELKLFTHYLMALIDMYENSSEESFDQHRQYAIWFKEILRSILPYRDKTSKIFYHFITRPEAEDNCPEMPGTAMIAYCILRGCRLGILQREKYQYIGEEIFRELLKQSFEEADDEHMGATALAYAEFLQVPEEV